MTENKRDTYDAIHIPKRLKGTAIIRDCSRLLGLDEYGKRRPDYAVVMQALRELKARLEAANDTGKSGEVGTL